MLASFTVSVLIETGGTGGGWLDFFSPQEGSKKTPPEIKNDKRALFI
jgi:hypothetical protein